MAESKSVLQDSPAPTCFSVNVFSGCVIAKGLGNSPAAAKDDAKNEADAKRQALRGNDEARPCPGNCAQGATSSNSDNNLLEIVTHSADAVTPVFVSYWWGGWRVVVSCQNQQQFKNLDDTLKSETLEHAVPKVCPGTRTMTGCVVSMAIRTTKQTALSAARAESKRLADGKVAAVRGTECAAGCVPEFDGEPVTIDLGDQHEIKQAKQGSTKKFVAYAATYWVLQVTCATRVAMRQRRNEGTAALV